MCAEQREGNNRIETRKQKKAGLERELTSLSKGRQIFQRPTVLTLPYF